MSAELYDKGFRMLRASCACAAGSFGAKLAFWIADKCSHNTSRAGTSHLSQASWKITLARKGGREGRESHSQVQCHLFVGQSATLFVGRILQWWISYCRWQADNKRRRVRGRDVIKTSSHITIRLPLPPLRLFPSPPPLPLLLPTFFFFFFLFFVFSSDEMAFSGCMANENDGETDKKRKKEGRGG